MHPQIGRTLYRKHDIPYAKKETVCLREVKKFSAVQLKGTLNPLSADTCEAGYDVTAGLTPCPVGDIEYEQMRQLAPKNTILRGEIPNVFFAPDFPDKIGKGDKQ